MCQFVKKHVRILTKGCPDTTKNDKPHLFHILFQIKLAVAEIVHNIITISKYSI